MNKTEKMNKLGENMEKIKNLKKLMNQNQIFLFFFLLNRQTNTQYYSKNLNKFSWDVCNNAEWGKNINKCYICRNLVFLHCFQTKLDNNTFCSFVIQLINLVGEEKLIGFHQTVLAKTLKKWIDDTFSSTYILN